MYLGGTQYDFEQKLHQLPTSSGDCESFLAEGNAYVSSSLSDIINRWEREFAKKYYQITNSSRYFLEIAFVGADYLRDVNNEIIYDVNGNPISF